MFIKAPSIKRRLACWLYEGMIMFGVVFVAGYLFGSLTQTRHGLDNRHALQAFLFVIFGIYFGWFWHKGQTIAMKAWHISLTDHLGKPVSQSRAIWRYVLCWVWFLPPLGVAALGKLSTAEISVIVFGWVLIYAVLARFAPGRQFWHDIFAGTRLVDAKPGAAPPALT